jgi:hypothetical protein
VAYSYDDSDMPTRMSYYAALAEEAQDTIQ